MSSIPRFLILSGCMLLASCNEAPQGPAPTPTAERIDLSKNANPAKLGIRAYDHTAKILSFGQRPPESKGLKKTKAYLKSELKKFGWQSVEQTFVTNTPKGKMQFSNVIARYAPNPGQNPWKRNVDGLLCAHIDSKILPNFLGADDAASCAGAILAIAEHLHKNHPKSAQSLELVFFDGEEAINQYIIKGIDGLYGSVYYSKALIKMHAQGIVPYKKKPQFGILLDMVGHKNLSIKIPSDSPKSLVASYEQARQKLGYQSAFGYGDDPITDDHVPLNEIARVPTINIIGDFTAFDWWHTKDDNLDLISPKSLKMSIEMTLEILSNHL